MRIAQLSPLVESVPPKLYGGTERVVSYLTEELVALGHDVTLFASGDSRTSARLVPICPRALRLAGDCLDPLAYHVAMVAQVRRMRMQFDVIHNHVEHMPMAVLGQDAPPLLTTLHGRLDAAELDCVYRHFPDLPVVSISDAQRHPLPWMNWVATVHHGLPTTLLTAGAAPERYLAFLGRISPEKGPDVAIRLAIRAGRPIKLAAKVDAGRDKAFFESQVRPWLDHPLVEFIGEIGEDEKGDFLGRAYALIFPISWPEPFGMVMIEAMACGTSIIAFRRGSVAELIEHGTTGFVVDSEEEALSALAAVPSLDRRRIRSAFERRFTSRRMAEDYLRIYELSAEPESASLVAAVD
jgi:glycosyltransferase involved in cell wall biosynthesis